MTAKIDRDEQARLAIKNFRAMLPGFNGYVRALTGRPSLRIQVTSDHNSATDGNTIFIRPPMALGDPRPHTRRLCDKRDEVLQQRCPACRLREEVLVLLYHEMAHIAFDTFAPVHPQDAAEFTKRAADEVGTKYSREVVKRLEAMPERQRNNYMTFATMINEFLPMILNSLEDSRVNSAMFRARKGTRRMFEAHTWSTFTEGVEQMDENGNNVVKLWRDYPANSQAIIGLYCKASGYKYDTFFHPQVVRDLGDAVLTDICNSAAQTTRASEVYDLSFKALARLRELGYCKSERDPEDEEEPDGEPEAEPEVGTEPSDTESDEPDGSEEESESGGEDEGGDTEAGHDLSEESSDSESDPEPEEQDSGEGSGETPESDSESSDGDGSQEGSDDDGSDSEGQGGEVDGEAQEGVDPDEDSASGGETESDRDEGPGTPEDAGGESVGSDPDAEEADGEDDADSSDGEGNDSDNAGSGDTEASSDGSLQSEGSEPDGSPESGDSRLDSDESDASEDADLHSDKEDDLADGRGEGAPSDDQDSSGKDEQADADHSDSDEGGRPTGDDSPGKEAESETDDGTDGAPDGGDDSPEPDDLGGEDGEPIGAQEGDGIEAPLPEYGEASDVAEGIAKALGHERHTGKVEVPEELEETAAEEKAMKIAIIQGDYFETPSSRIHGVREHRNGDLSTKPSPTIANGWSTDVYSSYYSKRDLGVDGDFDASEAVLGPALMRMRVAFSDNKRSKTVAHLKAGKINQRALGRRAWGDDERLFKKKSLPGKRSYFVVLGMDISGSTVGENIVLAKECVMAQAELLSRMGIPFAVCAHSGAAAPGETVSVDIYWIKSPDEPWTEKTRELLRTIGPDSANLDGHTIEFYRKVLDSVVATDKITMYYTDGKMPAENFEEELEILQREIKIYRQKGYTLMAVGIRTDSPLEHNLDTVRVDYHSDIVGVVRHLERRLERGVR